MYIVVKTSEIADVRCIIRKEIKIYSVMRIKKQCNWRAEIRL